MSTVGRLFDAVVFDLDGVITDTERVVHDVWAAVFRRFDCSFTLEEWSTTVGTDGADFNPIDALLERAEVPVPPRGELERLIEIEVERQVRGLAPLPGVAGWIADARELGLAVAVASSSPRGWVEARLVDAGIADHFTVVACRDERLRAKPAPDVYLDACSRLGVPPRRAIAVEDSTNGIAAAVAAGLACVAVRNDNLHRPDVQAADLVLASLADLPLHAVIAHLGQPARARTRQSS